MLLYSAMSLQKDGKVLFALEQGSCCVLVDLLFFGKEIFFGGGKKRESTEPMIKFSIEAFSG